MPGMTRAEEATVKIMRLLEQIKDVFDEYEPDRPGLFLSICRSKKHGDSMSVHDTADADENHYIDGFKYGDVYYCICDKYIDADEFDAIVFDKEEE